MDSTSVSLLRRLRQPNQEAAWQRFVDLYAPLIFYWGTSQGLNSTDAADLVQEVLAIMVTKLPELEYDPKKRFRGWLRTITLNRARDFHRRNSLRPVNSQEETIQRMPAAIGVDLFEESEHRKFLVRRSLELMKSEFQEQSWQACWKHVVEGMTASEVGQELGISANAVRVAKCRILRRLREELDGLWD